MANNKRPNFLVKSQNSSSEFMAWKSSTHQLLSVFMILKPQIGYCQVGKLVVLLLRSLLLLRVSVSTWAGHDVGGGGAGAGVEDEQRNCVSSVPGTHREIQAGRCLPARYERCQPPLFPTRRGTASASSKTTCPLVRPGYSPVNLRILLDSHVVHRVPAVPAPLRYRVP
ncbi:hypothetical protein ON010_g5417 [Phytophthora cinnamomi]|nr:hypothetical protein ON010_g5417 [Phytophthora cinnamomi]